ncbi:MAG TPA: triose-phosphate isomerase [Candidatus Paceibacterota bacterium]|nr:triose-phosphate isomerase [Candidatus Paceibacterota bacterium]
MLIVANWKAYVETPAKAKALLASAKRLSVGKAKREIALAPAYPYIGLLAGTRAKVKLAAQDVGLSESGAHTGEVSAGALTGLGVSYAIIGHSERRAAGEDDEVIARKVAHALASKLTPVLCIGETERDPDAAYLKRIREQLRTALTPLTGAERAQVVIAYEPVWAIGKSGDEAITPADLAEMIAYVRKLLEDFMPGRAGDRVRILYGGSVDAGNARALSTDTGIDGLLVGRASTDVTAFSALVRAL